MLKTLNLWWAAFHELRDLLYKPTAKDIEKASAIVAKILHDGDASGNSVYRVCNNKHEIMMILDSPESVRDYFNALTEGEISGNENDSYMEIRRNGERVFYSVRHTVEKY